MRMTVMAGALALVLLCGPMEARAGFITGQLWLDQTAAAQNATLDKHTMLGDSDATFSSGAFDYETNNSDATSISTFLNSPTFTNTSAGFSASHATDNTYFYFTGTIHLNAGNNSFVVGHDDGLQLNIDGIGLVVDRPGPTGFTDTPFNVDGGSGGDFNFELSYGECCGGPADLLWQVNGATVTSATPEPASAVLLSIGVAGLAIARRRKSVAA